MYYKQMTIKKTQNSYRKKCTLCHQRSQRQSRQVITFRTMLFKQYTTIDRKGLVIKL